MSASRQPLDGFIVPELAARFIAAPPASPVAAVTTLTACAVAVNVLPLFAITAMAIANGAWSLDLAPDPDETRLAGFVGIGSTALTFAMLLRGGPSLEPHALVAAETSRPPRVALVEREEPPAAAESKADDMHDLTPLVSLGVFLSTAATDAVYVFFNAEVTARRRVRAASWSSLWYLLSAFAVISYTKNPAYAVIAAAGSWVGAYLSVSFLGRAGKQPG